MPLPDDRGPPPRSVGRPGPPASPPVEPPARWTGGVRPPFTPRSPAHPLVATSRTYRPPIGYRTVTSVVLLSATTLASGFLAACGPDPDEPSSGPPAGTSPGRRRHLRLVDRGADHRLRRRRVQLQRLAGVDRRRRSRHRRRLRRPSAPATSTSPTPPARSTPEEVAACEAAGIEFIELEIALDGITVITSAANDDVECLTFADLYALLGPESDGVDRWNDAQELAGQLGSSTELPDCDLDITAPGQESGTYDAFVELDRRSAEPRRRARSPRTRWAMRTDYSVQADDNAIIAGIEGSEHQPRLRRASPSPTGRRRRQGAPGRRWRRLRRARRPRPSPTAPTRSPGRSTSTSTPPSAEENAGRRRVRRLLPRPDDQPRRPRRGGRLRAAARRPGSTTTRLDRPTTGTRSGCRLADRASHPSLGHESHPFRWPSTRRSEPPGQP